MYSVMIVDDEEILRIELKRLIDWSKMGFTVLYEARNGFDALAKLSSVPVDLVITDIKMPKVDGIELLRELKEKKLYSCLVFLSGYSDFKYAQQGLELGAFDYLLKPVDSEKLIKVLKRVDEFLTDKKNEEEEKRKLIEKLKDGLEIFYSEEKDELLRSYVVSGDKKAIELAFEIFAEISKSLNNDVYKVKNILYRIVSNISKELNRKFPFLNKIFSFEKQTLTGFMDIDILENIKNQFISIISESIKLISDYRLNQKDNLINKVCEYVLNNVDGDITLKSVSEHFYISKNYLSFLFKQETGENFLEYLTRIKMERAKLLLREGVYKAYEVSNILGYRETAYFSKLFKKHTGFGPTEFRKSIL